MELNRQIRNRLSTGSSVKNLEFNQSRQIIDLIECK